MLNEGKLAKRKADTQAYKIFLLESTSSFMFWNNSDAKKGLTQHDNVSVRTSRFQCSKCKPKFEKTFEEF